jgi:undecaprenyl diphosphate synthase
MSQIKHVAIIMDGNGRWANKRLHPRIWGHVRGSAVVSDIVSTADELKLKTLTLYAFSTENWARPLEEVSTLFKLLKKFLIKEKNRILTNNIKFRVIGEIGSLPAETIDLINDMERLTLNATGLNLIFAFNYGGRSEIMRAVNSFQKINQNRLMTEEDLNEFLYCPEVGDVDLMIRTGGEQRISNFLIWQMAYAEMYFTHTKWPDFTPSEFREILKKVSLRERRFGNISDQPDLRGTVIKADAHKMSYALKVGTNV